MKLSISPVLLQIFQTIVMPVVVPMVAVGINKFLAKKADLLPAKIKFPGGSIKGATLKDRLLNIAKEAEYAAIDGRITKDERRDFAKNRIRELLGSIKESQLNTYVEIGLQLLEEKWSRGL
jgi:hypothetical protein